MENLSINDETPDWETAEGIPKPSDPVMAQYFKGRDALLAQEDKHRSDKDFKALLSPMAQEACAIFNQIRFEELQTVWTAQPDDDPGQGPVYPGMMFALAKERMEQTKLYKIVQKMPKGALLHCHWDALVDQEWLFNTAIETPGIHMAALSSLRTSIARDTVPFEFRYISTAPKQDNIWSGSYAPETFVPIAEAAETFPDGGREAFVDWLRSRCSITPGESLLQYTGLDVIWDKFNDCFGALDTLVFYEPIYRKFLRRVFTKLAEDNVRWVDLRAAFNFHYYRQGSDNPDDDYFECMRVLQEEITTFRATEAGSAFWGARLIWTSIRSFDDASILASMKQCIAIKTAFPTLIAGFDLVGQEDAGRSLASLTPLLFWFRKACATASLTIPFFFHAGETLGSGSDPDSNLFDAILLGSRRLGHAFSLYKHPLLMNIVRDRRILVECCPISNEVLRLAASVAAHPAPALLANGVPLALCNDDPGVLGHNDTGLSADFYAAVQGWESLGLEGLGALAENSVRWAAFEDQDNTAWNEGIKAGMYGTGMRARCMKEWHGEWERFCQWVVVEYGVDVDLEPED